MSLLGKNVLDFIQPQVAPCLQTGQLVSKRIPPKIPVHRHRANLGKRLFVRNEYILTIVDHHRTFGHGHRAPVVEFVVANPQFGHLDHFSRHAWHVVHFLGQVERAIAGDSVARRNRRNASEVGDHDLAQTVWHFVLRGFGLGLDGAQDCVTVGVCFKFLTQLGLGDVIPMRKRLLPVDAGHVLAVHAKAFWIHDVRLQMAAFRDGLDDGAVVDQRPIESAAERLIATAVHPFAVDGLGNGLRLVPLHFGRLWRHVRAEPRGISGIQERRKSVDDRLDLVVRGRFGFGACSVQVIVLEGFVLALAFLAGIETSLNDLVIKHQPVIALVLVLARDFHESPSGVPKVVPLNGAATSVGAGRSSFMPLSSNVRPAP